MRNHFLTFINILVAAALLFSPLIIGLTASQYDPWADINEDGKIDIKDIAYTAKLYGTLGDPTKNVTVTNWPTTVTPETTVWYSNSSLPLTSANYSGSGFSYLHIFLGVLYPGPGASIEFRVRGIFQDTDSPSTRAFTAYSVVMTEDPRRDVLSVTIPVPSETFYFYVHTLSGGGTIFLSFYLTQG